eukprot:1684189-Prymnesium_polylepis.1
MRDRITWRRASPSVQNGRACAGARVSLMQWQDSCLGGRGLRSAGRVGTCVGERVRFVGGGEKKA